MAILSLSAQIGTDGKTWYEVAPWLEYQAKVDAAYMVDLRWTATYPVGVDVPKVDPKVGVDPIPNQTSERHPYRLLIKGKDCLILEEPGVSRTVWRDGKGIAIDVKRREYRLLKAFPKFKEAEAFRISALRPEPLAPKADSLPWHTSVEVEKGSGWTFIQYNFQHIDAFGSHQFWFEPKSKLLGKVSKKYWGMWERGIRDETITVDKFDLTPLLTIRDFPLEPPAGFTEATSGS